MRLVRQKLKTPINNIVAYGLLLVIIAVTLLSLAGSTGGNVYLEIASNFKLQYLVISLLIFAFLASTRQQYFLLIGLVCIMINLVAIVPWYIPHFAGVGEATNKVRILLCNITPKNQNYAQVISLLRSEKPDIAVLLNINNTWIEKLSAVNDILPYPIGRINPDNVGIAVYSKRFLENPIISSLGNQKNAIILGDFTISKQVVSLVAPLPLPPLEPTLFKSRNQQLEEISQYIHQLKNPVVMVGDFNTTMWSAYYKRFLQNTGLRNARQGFGILSTWPTKEKFSSYQPPLPLLLSMLLSIPIDHCLVSPEVKVVNIRTGPNVGSEHLPLITDLVISSKGS